MANAMARLAASNSGFTLKRRRPSGNALEDTVHSNQKPVPSTAPAVPPAQISPEATSYSFLASSDTTSLTGSHENRAALKAFRAPSYSGRTVSTLP